MPGDWCLSFPLKSNGSVLRPRITQILIMHVGIYTKRQPSCTTKKILIFRIWKLKYINSLQVMWNKLCQLPFSSEKGGDKTICEAWQEKWEHGVKTESANAFTWKNNKKHRGPHLLTWVNRYISLSMHFSLLVAMFLPICPFGCHSKTNQIQRFRLNAYIL